VLVAVESRVARRRVLLVVCVIPPVYVRLPERVNQVNDTAVRGSEKVRSIAYNPTVSNVCICVIFGEAISISATFALDAAGLSSALVSFQFVFVTNEIFIPPVEVFTTVGSVMVRVATLDKTDTTVGVPPTPASGLLIDHAAVLVVGVIFSLQYTLI